jgi:hypothetical protein
LGGIATAVVHQDRMPIGIWPRSGELGGQQKAGESKAAMVVVDQCVVIPAADVLSMRAPVVAVPAIRADEWCKAEQRDDAKAD